MNKKVEVKYTESWVDQGYAEGSATVDLDTGLVSDIKYDKKQAVDPLDVLTSASISLSNLFNNGSTKVYDLTVVKSKDIFGFKVGDSDLKELRIITKSGGITSTFSDEGVSQEKAPAPK